MKISTRKLASAAVVGAAYAALTLLLAPISFGLVQFRVSEALCILPAFVPFTAWGLWAAVPSRISRAGTAYPTSSSAPWRRWAPLCAWPR